MQQESKSSREAGGMLSNMTPGQTFLVGAVGGVLVLCTIGFFILLSVVLGGGGLLASADNGAEPIVINNQPTGAAAAETGPISVRGVDEKTDHILGAKNAKVTIIEYSDFECPFCSRFHPTMEQIIDTYGDQVRWVYRHFPLTSIHPDAIPFAHATECAAEQDRDKFWEMASIIFDNQTAGSSDSTLRGYAQSIGLNVSDFESCMSSQKYAKHIQDDANEAVAAGGAGTPYSIIIGPDGETVPLSGAQPYTAVEAAVKQFLN
jgi:protein-disulfide isomerase